MLKVMKLLKFWGELTLLKPYQYPAITMTLMTPIQGHFPAHVPLSQVRPRWASSRLAPLYGWSAPSYRDTPTTDCTPSQQRPLSNSSSETSLYSCREGHSHAVQPDCPTDRSNALKTCSIPPALKGRLWDQMETRIGNSLLSQPAVLGSRLTENVDCARPSSEKKRYS